MTLKQFFQIAGGALISLLIYSSGLHALIKWPLILFFTLFGVALAFLPFEDRPLEKWVIAFFRSVYSPTIYNWGGARTSAKFFQDEAKAPEDKVLAPQGEEALKEYLKTPTGRGARFAKTLEDAEKAFLSSVTGLFGRGGEAQAPAQPVQTQPQPAPAQTVPQPQVQAHQQQPSQPAPQQSGGESRVKIPKTELISVEKTATNQEPQQQTEKPQTPADAVVQSVLNSKPQARVEEPKAPTQQANFSEEAAPPSPPGRENTITGQTLDAAGKIVEGAILEIKDTAGRPVRAVKTNKLGHFIVVTPLSNGMYEIVTEKGNLEFPNLTFEAKGEIIPPIAIRARNALETNGQENASQ